MIRETEAYKTMTPYEACAIVEGFSGKEETWERQKAAWQYLHDTRMAYSLQGWYGRTATGLIEAGEIEQSLK
jgi:hypothetical protein